VKPPPTRWVLPLCVGATAKEITMREVILPSGASWVKHGGKSGAPEAAVDSPLETWTKTCRSSTLGRLVAGVPLLLCAVLVLPRSAQADLQGSLLFGPAPPRPLIAQAERGRRPWA